MIKLIDNNISLYKPEKDFYLSSLDFAKKLPESKNKKIIFHCFWRVPREFDRKQLAVLKSIITSHIDELENIEINLWSNVDLSENIYFKEVSKCVNLKKWNLYDEIKGTILEDCIYLKNENIYDDLCYLEGDVFRLLILYKYGGFYIDMDVLVLRNMRPLNDLEFQYQWGTSGFSDFEPNITMNGAVMRLEKESSLSLEFLEILKKTPPNKNTTSWGNRLYSNINKNDLFVLPGIWFNSEWGFENTTLEYTFKNIGHVDFFDGAFTWHWHNKWDEPIESGSKFELLEKKINKIYDNMNP